VIAKVKICMLNGCLVCKNLIKKVCLFLVKLKIVVFTKKINQTILNLLQIKIKMDM